MDNGINGILNLYKPSGITSHTALNVARRLFGCKKAGHCGTLDPNACGVLPVMLGNAVKASEYLTDHDKCYTAELVLGRSTDTGDISGTTISTDERPVPCFDEIAAAVASFVGDSLQLPPMYSALKVNGMKLVDAARKGEEIERVPRPIHIYSATASRPPEESTAHALISVACSRGTYIRVLCEDIGKKLGFPACMGALKRTRVGSFDIADSVTLEEIRAMSEEEKLSLIQPTDIALSAFPAFNPDGFNAKLLKNGCAVDVRKLKLVGTPAGALLRVYEKSRLIGIGEVLLPDDDGVIALKMKKNFV